MVNLYIRYSRPSVSVVFQPCFLNNQKVRRLMLMIDDRKLDLMERGFLKTHSDHIQTLAGSTDRILLIILQKIIQCFQDLENIIYDELSVSKK